MKKNKPHNSSENKNKSIFKAPFGILQLINGFKLSLKFTLAVAVVFSLLLLQPPDVQSKRSTNISFGSDQTINIFPSQVETTDWAGLNNVLIQDLPNDALYQNFGAQSSAYVPLADLFVPQNGEPELINSQVQPQADSSSSDGSQPALPNGTSAADAAGFVENDAISLSGDQSTSTQSEEVSNEISDNPVTESDSSNADETVVAEPLLDDVPEKDDGFSVQSEPESDESTAADVSEIEEEIVVESEVEVVAEPVEDSTAETESSEPEPSAEPEEAISLIDILHPKYGVFSVTSQLFPLMQLSFVSTTEPVLEESTPLETDSGNIVDVEEDQPLPEEAAPEETFSSSIANEGVVEEIDPLSLSDEVVEIDTTTSTSEILNTESSLNTKSIESPVADDTSSALQDSPVTSNSSFLHEITLSNFDTAPLDPGQFVQGMQLRLSLAAQLNDPVADGEQAPYIEILFGQGESLETVGIILLEDEVSNALNGGYFLFALPELYDIDNLASTTVSVRYMGEADLLDGMFLDAAWLELDTKIITKEDLEARGNAAAIKKLDLPTASTLISDQVNFRRDETPVFNLRYNSKRNTVLRGLRDLFGRDLVEVESALVKHRGTGLLGITPEINITNDGLLTVSINEKDRKKLRPGQYTVEITYKEGGETIIDTFDFQWGILTTNPNKSEYEVGETAQISVGVLTPTGHTVCDANLDLYVTDPEGFVSRYLVDPSGLCDGNNVIDVPDFSTFVPVTTAGVYELYLERLDDDGSVLGFTTDTFNAVPLQQTISIERTGPTRIYPLAPYTMSLKVDSAGDFDGTLTEYVPASFVVFDTDASVEREGEWLKLVWDLSVSASGTETISYQFDAPDISPYLFTLGPARLDSNDASTASSTEKTARNNVFIEHRRWQIASDAVGKMLLFWDDGAAIPAGWVCVSCAPADPFYQRFIMGSSTYNSTGGAATHTHTTSGSVLASLLSTTESGSGTIAPVSHTHTYTPTISGESNLPPYRQLRVIRYDTAAGEPATIPAGAIGIFDVASSSLPANWNRYGAQDGSFIYGEDTPATTGGTTTHTHGISGTTGASAGAGTRVRGGGTQVSGAGNTHTHTVTASSDSHSNEPPYITVLLAELSVDSAPTNGLIAMWDEDIDDGWLSLSADSEAFSNRFIKPTTTYGTTGGGETHDHADVTGITSSAPSATQNARSGSSGSDGTHTHSVSVTGFSTESNLPPYVTVVFGKRQGTSPVYEQLSSRWYANNESAQTPTEPWPNDAGVIDLAEDEPITATSSPVKNGEEVRLRINVGVTNATSTAGEEFQLQYTAANICTDGSAVWSDVGDVASSTAFWRGYNNVSITDHGTLSSTLLASSTVEATYEENGYSTTTPNDISVGEYGEWDFVLQHNGALAGTNYCFRMVEKAGATFQSYTQYPQIYTNESPNQPTLSKLFDAEKTASTSPWFYFVASDTEGENIHYEIEIADNYAFASPAVSKDTISNSSQFENQLLISDKAPFRQGELMKFTPSASFTNGTTYYWHVRARDPEGSDDWSEWSSINSFTIDTALTASAWFQTETEQFDENILDRVDTATDQADIAAGSTTAAMTGGLIDFTDGEMGTAWDSLTFNETDGSGVLLYQIEYLDNSDTWTLIPDVDLPGNSTGFNTSPVNLLSLDVETYNSIRVVADFSANTGTPSLQDWTINWGYRVDTPMIASLFANEQTGTTTPTLEFTTTDPQNDSLTYQLQWSLTPDFAASTTRTSDADAGFTNINTGADLDPFNSGDTIQFTVQAADALTGSTTYWWRVRAKDTTGDDAYSFWTDAQSFTVIPGTEVSTWFQTSADQFSSNILSGTTPIGIGAVTVATTAVEAMIVYGEGTLTSPRYRQWDGTNLGAEDSMQDIDSPLKWAVVRAAPTREEYVAATVGTDADVNAQVFSTGSWENLQEMTISVGNINARGFDVAYETLSGDALVVYCDGDADPSYYVWNGTSWTSGGTINLASINNCEWIKLAADPVSDEIVLMARDSDGTAAASYELQVWNGTAWGNSSTQGGARNTAYETMALKYEESGGQLLSVSGDGNPARFEYNSWNGTAWAGNANDSTIADNIIWAELTRDEGTDNMTMCYVDESVAIGAINWTGAAWSGQIDLDATGNAIDDKAVSCVYESTTGRDGNLMTVYSDATNSRYRVWNGVTWSAEASVSTITDVSTIQTIRTGIGGILGLFYDDVNDAISFSDWNGSAWSAEQTVETNGSVDTVPYGQPFFMAPRNPGGEGTVVVSPALNFDDGNGPYWKTFSWNDVQPGTSEILYHLQYQTATGSWAFIPDVDLPDNVAGTSTGPYDLSLLNTGIYDTIRPYAELTCDGSGNCPELQDWKVEWAGGIVISGTAALYDETTALNSGTVAVAVNGVLQVGKTANISAGAWSITNVTTFPSDVVTVFITGAADSGEAVAVSRYDGQGDMSGMDLFERHLTLGSNDATTTPLTNADIGLYDFTNTEDIFFDLSGATLTMCADAGCSDAELYVQAGTYYEPAGAFVAHDFENNGYFTAGAYTHEINGSWDNNATTTMTGSTVVFAATSTTESVDNTGAVTPTFDNIRFGTTTGNGTWTLESELDVNGDLIVDNGTLARGTTSMLVAGDLTTGTSGFWSGIGTTTFDGADAANWSDQNAVIQNVGNVVVDGTNKVVILAGDAAAESIIIGADDTLDVSVSNYDLTVYGDWTNQNNFLARAGTVFFAATSSGQAITSAGDAFYDLSFVGINGGWSFIDTALLVNNDFAVATGTVTLPTATTTIDGSFDSTGGSFAHNNGTLLFTSDAAENITLDGDDFTNVTNNLIFDGAGTWNMLDVNATSTGNVTVSQGTVNFPSGTLAIGGSLTDDGGTFVGGTGTARFYSAGTETVTTGGSSFNNLTFDGAGDWSFVDTNSTIAGDLLVLQGTTTFPTGNLLIGGSYQNAATVDANSGTVTFDSADTGEAIDFGNSALYDVSFTSVSGGWTITAVATTTNNFSLVAGSDFTLDSGQILSVGANFTNSIGGASTTWTGSTLSLENGAYSINTKTDNGDVYETLRISATADVKMWNSSAATYNVLTGGSLYSQDHTEVDGELYIFGAYENIGGNEYWSYATDFDGADLIASSSERQAQVYFASGGSALLTNSSFEMLGDSTASSTVQNQGSGTYGVTVESGTTTAQYYEFNNLGGSGLSLLDSSNVISLRDGYFEVTGVAGTALTLASSTIDANPAKQIYNVTFATSSAIFANNVTQSGAAPTSYWWFRDGFGNLYGEAKDNDSGDPGSVRFDDSSLVLTIAGTVYTDAGTTELTGGTCDGATPVVRIMVDDVEAARVSCSAADGSYSAAGIIVIGDPTITVYLDNASGGEQGSAITRTPTADIADMDIYANRVIVRNEDAAALTIENLAVLDSSDDADLNYSAATSTSGDTLSVASGNELFVWASSTFTPSGAVTLAGEAAANSYDGTLYLAGDATFNAYSTSTVTIGGRLELESGAVFSAASTTVLMNATTTGKSITAVEEVSFNELVFDGVGGGWNLSADIRVAGDMTITNGTVTGTGDIYMEAGGLTGNGTLSLGGGTTTLATTNSLGGSTAWTFFDLTLGDAIAVGTTTPLFTSTTTVSGKLTISAAHYLDAGNTAWDLAGSGTVFEESGTFLEDTSTIRYSGANADVLDAQYYNLTLDAGAGSATYTAVTAGLIVDNDLVIGGTANTTFDLNANNVWFDVNADVFVGSNGTLSASAGNNFTIAGSYDNDGTFTANGGTLTFDGAGTIDIAAGTSDFNNLEVIATGDVTFSESATSSDLFTLTAANSFTLASGETLAVGGAFYSALADGDTTWTGTTLRLYGGNNYSLGAATSSDSYATLDIDDTTQIRMWNSDALVYDVAPTASLYSQDHAGVDGDLYIWGDYNQTSANDYWSFATDFDGTALGLATRKVDVYINSGSSVTYTNGSLSVIGDSAASTTIQNQGSGTYSLTIGGTATTEFNYYEIRDIDIVGLLLTGTPTITSLSYGDIEVSQTGGSGITVGGSVITQNPAKNFTQNRFARNGAASGFGVTATGTSVSSWRFANHTGDISGESFDVDPDGDPGYVAWDDSAALITISGVVYSDEGSTVSAICDGSTNNIVLRVAGITTYTSSCNATTGVYSVTSVSYGASDSLVAFIDGEAVEGTTVSKEPISNIGNFDIYENRVIVRHEDVNPITIADMAVWDSSDDADILFTAVDAGSDTLTLPADTKLIIWNGKTFAPAGDVTLSGGGAGAVYDGTLELYDNAVWSGTGTESIDIGGSLISGTGAIFTAGNGTTTFTTVDAGRTIGVNEAGFYNLTVTGSGDLTFTDSTLTVLGDYAQTAGTVTLPSATSTFSGSFTNSGTSFDANDGFAYFTGSGTHSVALGGSDLALVEFAGGTYVWSDTDATTTKSILISSGSLTLPSGKLTVGGNFENVDGTLAHNTSELVFTASTTAFLLASSSDLYEVRFVGGGDYTLVDEGLALLDSLTVSSGTLALASGTLSIGGSFDASGGSFDHASGTILFNSADTGEFIDAGTSDFYAVQISAPTGGYTLIGSATTTNNFTLAAANTFVAQSGSSLVVEGVFTNLVGGTNTTWSGSTLTLAGQNTYTVNTKINGGDNYDTLVLGANSDIRLWDSAATTTTVANNSSLYSQDNNSVDGALNIYGDFHIATTTEYWSYATDFDGTDLSGGSERMVTVSHATSATTTLDGGTLQIVGVSGNETLITNQGSGTFDMGVEAGTFTANYYQYRNLASAGLALSGTPVITSLSYGDFELAVSGGSLITLSSTTLNANASLIITGNSFATTSAITGNNVTLTGSTSNAWTFVSHSGNLDGENYDADGATACGQIRWNDSACLLTQQTNYRWRNDDGGLGVDSDEWYSASWAARQYVRVQNADATTYADAVVKMTVPYDGDMQSDFDDLRVTSGDGTTLLSHWIGASTAATEAELWVKIPTLTAEAVTDLYLYYNNPTATSTASSTAVFIAVDDFEDNDINEYSGQTSLFNVGTSFNYDGSYGLDNSGSESGRANTGGIYRFDQTVSQGETFSYQQYVDTSAGTSDEVCTMFGVQSPGSTNLNYAICLEQFGVDRISLVKDVVDNDASGTIIASSTVTFTTGWYNIEVDWDTDDSFNVSLFNPSGSEVANFTGSDSTYTSGGYGFTFWFHNGGWDSVHSRPIITTTPTVQLGSEQVDGGASWNATQNTLGIYEVNDIARLRLSVENSGLAITNQQYRLEYAALDSAPSCEAVDTSDYVAVPVQASCGTSPLCMQSSTQATNGAATAELLTNVSGTFTAGEVREDPSNTTGNIDIDQDFYTELEYAVTPTENVVDQNLCLRVTNSGTDLDTYLKVAQLVLRFDPTLGAITFNDGLPISLVPGTTTLVYATGTVTDLNGFADLVLASSTFYRSGVAGGAACTLDNNNCYSSTLSNSCAFTNCSGNSCVLECTAEVYYHADPTDSGSTFEGQEWLAFLEVEDTGGGYDFGSGLGIEMNTLRAIDVIGAIDYGALAVNSDTAAYNASTSVLNYGNVEVDLEVYGSDLSDGLSSVIPADQQKFATSTFTYSSCGLSCSLLSSTSPLSLDVDLTKPTTNAPPVEDEVYWGIAVPIGVNSVPHQGINVFTPVSP